MFWGEVDKSGTGKRWKSNVAAPRGDQVDQKAAVSSWYTTVTLGQSREAVGTTFRVTGHAMSFPASCAQ